MKGLEVNGGFYGITLENQPQVAPDPERLSTLTAGDVVADYKGYPEIQIRLIREGEPIRSSIAVVPRPPDVDNVRKNALVEKGRSTRGARPSIPAETQDDTNHGLITTFASFSHLPVRSLGARNFFFSLAEIDPSNPFVRTEVNVGEPGGCVKVRSQEIDVSDLRRQDWPVNPGYVEIGEWKRQQDEAMATIAETIGELSLAGLEIRQAAAVTDAVPVYA
jgi:hypothetical protein